MSGYLLAETAQRDIDAIATYVSTEFGPENAQEVIEALRATFEKIVAHPRIGHRRRDVTKKPVRFLFHESRAKHGFWIVYHPDTSPLAILRVLHDARDVYALLRDQAG